MHNSNLYFVYNSGSEYFWNRKVNQLTNEIMQGLLHDQKEMPTLYKIGKILKKIVGRRYKTFQQHLFYFRENGELGGFVVLKNVYYKITKRQATQNVPFEYCLTLTLYPGRLDLYYNYGIEIDQFLLELSQCCILNDFEKHYNILQQIGKGATAEVFLALNYNDQQHYAVKQIEKEHQTGRHRILKSKTLLEEIFMMRSVDHPNIVKLHYVYESEKYVYLVLSLYNGGPLMDKIKNFDLITKRELCKQLIETVNYMHYQGIMHRDLKPLNILYKTQDPYDWSFAICDFGFATSIKQQQHVLYKCGTPAYVAPEIIEYREKSRMYGLSCDVFSIAIIIYEIFFRTHPFKQKSNQETLRCILNSEIKFDERLNLPQSLKSLIISMARKNPRNRFTLQQCLDHSFFKENLLELQSEESEPRSCQVRTIRCQTLQIVKHSNVRRQSLPEEYCVSQEPQIQQRKSIMIKHRQSVASTHESKFKFESNQQSIQHQQQNQQQFNSPSISFRQFKNDRVQDVFFNDSHHIPKEFGITYLKKF